ncbi:hypothetical protein CL622_04190 [archaeon]|nr:hypothetical protein [archaeon]|tara:strand:+ start:358 stop:819 length:462 start_codon:yes stop_codon:yes gene_type:complete
MKIPHHVFMIFEDVLRKDIRSLLEDVTKKYGTKYGFTTEDLMEEFLPETKTFLKAYIPPPKSKSKSNKSKQKQTSKELCIARTWSGGKGLQCTKHAVRKRKYCQTHRNQIYRKGFLWAGTIYDKPNRVHEIKKKGYKYRQKCIREVRNNKEFV